MNNFLNRGITFQRVASSLVSFSVRGRVIAVAVLTALTALFWASTAHAQVINFDVPGGVSGFANYSGQGAYSDPGNNYWNAIVQNGTTSSCLLSDGATSSPITLSVSSDGIYSGAQGGQGAPSGLQSPFYDAKPGPKTCTLNNVPTGTYYLYLYGINGDSSDCNRGTTFTVGQTVLSTVNSMAAYNSFVRGNDYVVFSVAVGPTAGSITFTYQANGNVQIGGSANTIGCFNGLQLVATDFAGAATPFTTYEAEAGSLGGGASIVTFAPPSTTEFSSPGLEASGHAYVQLTAVGQSVSWTNNTGQSITAINVRSSVPPTTNGWGQSTTLDLYINGSFRQAIPVNSIHTWLYESTGGNYGADDITSGGSGWYPHIFWDESHVFITGSPVATGSTIMLKWDSSNTLSASSIGSFFYVDCIDLETPPPALSQPANSLSITSYGAVANNSSVDSTPAVVSCIAAAKTQGKSVWVPSGTFYLTSKQTMDLSGVTMGGAGPWYSAFYTNPALPGGKAAGFTNSNSSTTMTVKNLAVDGNGRQPADGYGNSTAFNIGGSNWTINNVWISHHLGLWGTGTNGIIENSRINNSWGDGININNGSGGDQLTVFNNFIRGSGDDCIAINAQGTNNMQSPALINNTTIASTGANEYGIYGGANILVQNNLSADSVKEHGIYLGTFSSGNPIQSGTVQGNVVLRGGGFGYALQYPAMGVGASPGAVSGLTISDNTVNDSMFYGVQFQSASSIVLQNNSIDMPGLDGINVKSSAQGGLTADNNEVTNVPSGSVQFNNQAGQTNFPVLFRNEGEFLTVQSISSGLTSSIITASQFSNGEAAYVNSDEIGNQVTYIVPGIPAGSYTVTIGVKSYTTRGAWQLAIGPAGGSFSNLGSPQDEYASSATFTSFNLGTWSPGTSSDKWFRFTITGKNVNSTGYDMAIDYILLTPQ